MNFGPDFLTPHLIFPVRSHWAYHSIQKDLHEVHLFYLYFPKKIIKKTNLFVRKKEKNIEYFGIQFVDNRQFH